MTITVKHHFVNNIPDDPAAVAAGEVVPSNWNESHDLTSTDPDGSIPFVSAGAISVSADFIWDEAAKALRLSNPGGYANIFGADGTSIANGTGISIVSGNALAGSGLSGGSFSLTAGNGDGAGDGGGFTLSGGNTDTGFAGQIYLGGGFANSTGKGGKATLIGGDSTGGAGGDCLIGPGAGVTNGTLYTQNVPAADPLIDGALFFEDGVLTQSKSVGALTGGLGHNFIRMFNNGATNQPVTIGATSSTGGTLSSTNPTGASLATSMLVGNYTTNTSAGSTAGYWTVGIPIPVSSFGNISIYVEMLFICSLNISGHQWFYGLKSNATPLAGDPSALTNILGIGADAADLSSGNWILFSNDGTGTATRIDTGIARNSANMMRLRLTKGVGTTNWDYVFEDMSAATSTSGTLSTNTIDANTLVGISAICRNGATTSSARASLYGAFAKWRAL